MNGQQYDAVTGQLLATPKPKAPKKGNNIDGFSKSSTTHINLAPPRIQPPVIEPAVTRPTMQEVAPRRSRSAAKHATKQTQASQTLMRHAVTKPGASTKRTIKAHSHTGALVANPKVETKKMATSIDNRRQKLSEQVPKSAHVSKFTAVKPHNNPAALAPKQQVHKVVAPVAPPATKPKNNLDMFTQALEQATSHEQTYKAPRSKSARRSAAAFVALAVVVGVGFAGVNGVKAAKVQLASSKAGFSVVSPAYTPAGFSFKGLSSEAGTANLSFISNSDDRAFTIIEKASQWDSGTLKSTQLDSSGKKYQTIESAGRIIYVDSDFNANWVSNGIWYQLQNDNALNNRQIINIAKSL